MDENTILEKTLDKESKITGLWREEGGELYSFGQVEPNDRIGDLVITTNTRPSTELRYKYEIIWVSENKIFFEKIWTSVPKKEHGELILLAKVFNCPRDFSSDTK